MREDYNVKSNLEKENKEILIFNNDIKHNFGLLGGTAIKIVRVSDDYTKNYCGPILFKGNNFEENFGCRTSFGLVNVHCHFGQASDLGYPENND